LPSSRPCSLASDRASSFAWLAKERPRLPLAEVVVLLFLVCATLILLATAYRPVRFYVVLIPPMCLLASRALTTWTRSSHLRLPSQISRIFPIVLFLGLAYLAYHLLASTVKLVNLARFQTGMKDIRVIADVPTLYGMLAAGLALGMVAVLVILRLILQNPGKRLSLPPRHIRSWIALGFVISVIIANGSQYLLWATEPQFSIVEASGQLEQDLGPGAVLGGPYAVVLAVGNRVPTLSFNPRLSDEELSALGITHLAMWSTSDFYKRMREEHATLRRDPFTIYKIPK